MPDGQGRKPGSSTTWSFPTTSQTTDRTGIRSEAVLLQSLKAYSGLAYGLAPANDSSRARGCRITTNTLVNEQLIKQLWIWQRLVRGFEQKLRLQCVRQPMGLAQRIDWCTEPCLKEKPCVSVRLSVHPCLYRQALFATDWF